MVSQALLEIERSIRALSIPEQAWLLERIARQIRERTQTADRFADSTSMKEQLTAMAIDPDIQSQITTINEEFAVVEMDGLEEL